ncbi:tRNA (adenosine(37)-N6)-threonylcarbamoyltransferase complex dimerization subunit type 1 TsaB [uncultured Ruthenibacterium sp.]|uniref:tRNA (adenosine(37)-N6)-threonylcarbamoyltransferase complex dimerization subunit type 1 TsaB n=1 Tax=uncultured Ruthenibacterium sp. TaxID=1905347 RepID=UPI00349EFD22
MTIFGLDSTGKTASAAILKDGELIYESYLAAGLTHSETLITLCDNALKAVKLQIKDVDLFAVTHGPGSFTGLRIGLAAVKGLAFPLQIPCTGISTLEALAWGLRTNGSALCALDARRGEVYYAAFSVKDGTVTRLCEDASAPASQLGELVASLPGPVWCFGDGAQIVYDSWKHSRNDLWLWPADGRLCHAGCVCRAAQASGTFSTPAALVPEYRRLSQAERERALRTSTQ